jgi:hypothetical protein
MPEPPVTEVPGGQPPVRRRALLGGGLVVTTTTVLGLSSCGLRVGSPPAKSPSTSAPTAPASTDDRALNRALASADTLAAAYGRAVVVRPDLAAALRQMGADHAAHLRALQSLTAAPTSIGTPAPTGTPTAAGVPPLTAATAVSVLGQAERAAATQAQTDLVAVGAQPARLLASVAACRSAHVALLARLPQSAPPPKATS